MPRQTYRAVRVADRVSHRLKVPWDLVGNPVCHPDCAISDTSPNSDTCPNADTCPNTNT
jgi:hypothetical protein